MRPFFGVLAVSVLSVEATSTAGAGDAHLAGILAGLAAGLSLAAAQALGTLVAAAAVTSPHTIHDALSREELARLWQRSAFAEPGVATGVATLLGAS